MDIYNVLFLCTGNSARSIMGEALLNFWGKGRFQGFSAGSHPKGAVHPLAIETLRRHRLATDHSGARVGASSRQRTRPMQFVFTVCDDAAAEVCPVWPGQPMTAHRGIEDPAAVVGSDEVTARAFTKAFGELDARTRFSRACVSRCSIGWRFSASWTPSGKRPPRSPPRRGKNSHFRYLVFTSTRQGGLDNSPDQSGSEGCRW